MFTNNPKCFVGEFESKRSQIKIVRGFLNTTDNEKLFYTKVESIKDKPIANIII